MLLELGAAAVASAAVQFIKSFFDEASKKASETAGDAAGEAAGNGIVALLRPKLTPGSAEAMDDLAKDPSDPDNQAVLRKQLTKQLDADPDLLKELHGLLVKAGTDSHDMMTMDVGAGAKAVQNKGDNNAISIS
jgi:hypothetical protein